MKYRGIVMSIVAVTLISCGGPEERKANYRMRAQEYLEAGNYPKARVALRNVLKIDPKDAEAYYLFAQVEEKEKNWRGAVKLYQDVVELAPDHTGALITLAKYYLEARLTDQVIASADKVLTKDPRHPQAKALKIAVIATTDDKVPDAIIKAETLAAEFPSEPDVAILLATLYGQQQRYREAETVLRRSLAVHSRDMDLLNNLNTILVQAKDPAGAEAVARRMIETEPSSTDHYLRLARLFDAQGMHQQAESVLRQSVTLDPDSEQRRLLLADFLRSRKDAAAAEKALLEAAAHLPHSTKIEFGLASLYLRMGQESKARARYASLAEQYKDKPAGFEAKVKLAEMDFAAGKLAEAERQVRQVLDDSPRSPDGLILSGRMALARRDGKEAVQAFRTVLHDQPELATVQFLLGQAYQLIGEVNLARESFERAVALYPGQVDARRSLAALESRSGRIQQARGRLDDLLKQRPDDLAALEMLMNLDLSTKNWSEAERTLGRLRVVAGESYPTFMAEGHFHEAQRRLEEATRAYDRAAALAPNEPDPLLSVISLEVSRGRIDQARTRLETLLAGYPNHLYGHGLLGEVLTLRGESKQADLHFREATRVHPKWVTPWLDWAGMWMVQRQPDLAVQVLQSGLAANPESEELQMLLASAHSDQGRIDSAITAYEATLKLNPHNVLAANNLAVLLVDFKGDQPSLQKAFSLSRDFEKEAPHPLFLDTLAWVRLKMGQQEEALRLLKNAITKSPDLSVLNYHLGMAYYRVGKSSEARSYLSKALRKPDAFPGRQEAEQILAQIRG
jgi:tetratricopeptide (TPR) repeat protein